MQSLEHLQGIKYGRTDRGDENISWADIDKISFFSNLWIISVVTANFKHFLQEVLRTNLKKILILEIFSLEFFEILNSNRGQ